ncbi:MULTISPECIES: YczE/YyaS/YitT family protein [Sellimonas]|uniref:YitT family protein n=1 Tax=Sellimonas caecigallum TaxID=2592333 RepID=A0ABS7L4M9_9FIRM|nr:DUF6198 family protein [Sellimonas caecigallum]MBY0757984.1 YitT family protein [Sellimonas caecigallum]
MGKKCIRCICFMLGILINSFGIAFITKAALGTSPISSLPYVLSKKFPLTLGQFTFVMNMIFILMQIFLLKKDFQKRQILQIGVNVIFSAFIDISMNMLDAFAPSGASAQILSLLAGCVILAMGISIEVAPNVLLVPGEGVVKAISAVSRKRFGTVKVVFDTTLITLSFILSLLFFHRLNGLGIGTVISALAVGKIVNLCNRTKLIGKIRALS